MKNNHKQKKQIGCGYCKNEKICKKRDPKINKAKQGCKDWEHWNDQKNNHLSPVTAST